MTTAHPIKIFADGACLEDIARLKDDPRIKGFTTNPTLMRKAGVTDYLAFARQAAALAGKKPSKPISLEVLSDDFGEMERQAIVLSGLGDNVYVKIPITNCRGESSMPLVRALSTDDVRVNVTAVLTLKQATDAADALKDSVGAFISVFAGRVSDTGKNAVWLMKMVVNAVALRNNPAVKVLWVSTREVYNIIQAEECRCDAITVPYDLLKKLHLLGKDLDEFSLETVRMFREDAVAAGYRL